jgi:hypothetical protein
MARSVDTHGPAAWEQFVLQHGWRSSVHDLAHLLGQEPQAITRLRRTSACKRLPEAKGFAELFGLWHGRPPADRDWPAPRKFEKRGDYIWQPPELVLLASLVGQISPTEISQALTARLRQLTGDPRAVRTPTAIQVRINRIGMETTDVVGGITIKEASADVGSIAVVQQAIESGQLKARRVGRLWVIPHENWAAWKAKRTFPPDGYVLLASLREPLSIQSDKLSEFARMGHVPTAVRCNPYGKGPNTQFGTWYISPETAKKLLADRRAGRAMPWHGKPLADNLKASFKRWQKRKHPNACEICAGLWGKAGPPKTYEEYADRYPALAHGGKRHLTRPWSPGMTIDEVADHSRRTRIEVRQAMDNGLLAFSVVKGRKYITRTDATRWVAKGCPNGDGAASWVSLEWACKLYLFTMPEIRGLVAKRKLKSKTGTEGAMRGIVYVLRHQCGQLREKTGFTAEEAALRLGVTVARLRVLLEGVDWREAKRIPLSTVQAVRKRLDSRQGFDVREAAADLGTTVDWVEARIEDGTVRVARAKWDRRRRYLSAPMMARLREALTAPPPSKKLPNNSVSLGDAALDAGVSTSTLIRWAEEGDVKRQQTHLGWRYQRRTVRARARRYWQSVRRHRATPPAWLADELRLKRSRPV